MSQKVPVPAGKFGGFDHLHFWVGNALQASSFYISRFGFEPFAYRGFETGSRDITTHVVKQGKVIFAFSCANAPGNQAFGAHLAQHGDGVKDVAFTVDDCRAIYNAAVANGAKSVMEPKESSDENGTIIMASIQTYGDTIHTLVERKNYKGLFLPGFVPAKPDPIVAKLGTPVQLEFVDHIVGNQDWDGMLPVEEWYKDKLGFRRFWSVDDKQIHTEYSALRSVVVVDEDKTITMPINEPAQGKKKSQIQEYVEYYGGPGVQHIAITTKNILHSVSELTARGVRFLAVPKVYYDDLRKRLARSSVKVTEDLDVIEKLNILVDFDEEGYLLQIFTKPLEDRPTLFIEIIQRANHDGFGVGNFKALFEAIEREQELRGNL